MNKSSPGKILKSFLIQIDRRTPNKVKDQFSSARRTKLVKSIPNHWSKTLMVDIAKVYPSSLATQIAFEYSQIGQANIRQVTEMGQSNVSATNAVLLASDTVKGGNY